MKISRRRFVSALAGSVVAIPLSVAVKSLHAAEMPKLSPDDAAAKLLNYTPEAVNAEKRCSGCQFYTDSSAPECGPCVIFPDKTVSASGSCNSWFKRAS